ncbi:transposable element-related [Anaeramoeba flamelloides]|uniref:Transposable element-related n=1 Tax=Anaeramoeba flamelloides TaxID=1746091 RepID=A0ABQ8XW72_9EUKA|nr:transposable element-related [Anaeramoeba flamelloides]
MNNQEIRINILSLRNSGYSLRQIAIHLDINVSKVRYWLRKWEDEKKLQIKKLDQKNNKITQELKNFVEQETKKNRSMSSLALSKKCQEMFPNLSCSETSIFRIRKSLKFKYTPPRIRQCLNDLQKDKRLLFANHHKSLETDWKTVIFSDESWFYLNQKRRKIWRMRNEYDNSVWDERKKFGKKVMIWGGIGYRLQTDLIIIDSSVDTETYIHDIIRKSKIIKKANEQYGEWEWIFQQDGARPHTSKKSMDYLQYRCNVLSPWPPNSPDLNPIENLWSIMDKRLKNVQPSNEEEFILEIIRVWEGITWEIIENLVTSMTKKNRFSH